MKRQSNVPFSPSAPVYKQPQPGRIPLEFREAMKHISVKPAESSNTRTADTVAKTPPPPPRKRAAKSSAVKWKSSFKPVGGEEEGEEEDNSPDKSSPERVELYNPYDPASSDSEHEMPQCQDHNRSPADQDNNLGHQHLSPSRGCCDNLHWDSSYSEPGNRPLDRRDLNPETRPTECRNLSPGRRLPERCAFSPDAESIVPPGYGSMSRPVDHRVRSPDRLIHSSSTQRFPASYAGQRTNGEEIIPIAEYRRETTTVRLSPPRLQRDYQHQSGYMKTGLGELTPSTEKIRNGSKKIIMDKSPITCDLCEVELANGQELQDHLESKTHWFTLEHIQQENNYDDMAIAFLQEVMLFKSRQCSRAIEGSVLQALQENDHMTKIEIFHCAACNIFLSTSAASVQTHITSQEHLTNTKEFEVQQRRTCLNKAETMMKELKPQFEHFLKGGSPFE
ncbi:DBIRD complex subunit ZNF326 [Larimichthys crocea]|uniref:DBIRD complex subunit ZNF326 n=1 Tax=Larimichthys crocea TaxID=215358 RepID=A0A6G0IIJ7_LARCR|nr:DBIRD complex subunit ZNF326 [Larimichthys crocea]